MLSYRSKKRFKMLSVKVFICARFLLVQERKKHVCESVLG